MVKSGSSVEEQKGRAMLVGALETQSSKMMGKEVITRPNDRGILENYRRGAGGYGIDNNLEHNPLWRMDKDHEEDPIGILEGKKC
ncbi:hypothetical protein PVK06_040832 [Gossypium arboreum]|uniref:Uncharacterized protein n=1 Tax=Gossypium arboreum TaxID=29729 RepID=A0ABR0N6J4_GOSAR|nr:hypothetical protein PVK06_040832 [Gossypium arboreum]